MLGDLFLRIVVAVLACSALAYLAALAEVGQ